MVIDTFGDFKGNFTTLKFRIPYLPSGHPYTAFLNTVLSYNVVKYWRSKYDDPDEMMK